MRERILSSIYRIVILPSLLRPRFTHFFGAISVHNRCKCAIIVRRVGIDPDICPDHLAVQYFTVDLQAQS